MTGPAARSDPPPGIVAAAPAVAVPALKAISCPSCGGAAGSLAPGDVRDCPYCDTPLTIVAAGMAGSVAVETALDYAKARSIVEGFLSFPGTPEGLKSAATRRGIELMYVPFLDVLLVQAAEERPPVRCRMSAARLTAIALEDEGREWGGDRIPTERVRTCASSRVGAAALASRGIILAPQRRAESIRLPHVAGVEAVTIERRATIVYYPVWLARFTYGRSLYQVAVDGTTGEILRGVAPARMNRRVLAGVVFTLIFSVLAGLVLTQRGVLLQLLAHAGDIGLLAAGGLILVLAAAWDRLRFRRELVVEGNVGRELPINRPKVTALEAIGRALIGAAKSGGRRTFEWRWGS